jgi:hypothetical protein
VLFRSAINLQADKYAGHQNDKLDHEGEPVLIANGLGKAVQNHGNTRSVAQIGIAKYLLIVIPQATHMSAPVR